MGNGNAEENAQDRQAAFKNALTGKHLPVLTLDNKWYRLLNKTGSVPLKETEDALNQLLKRQGKLEGYPESEKEADERDRPYGG